MSIFRSPFIISSYEEFLMSKDYEYLDHCFGNLSMGYERGFVEVGILNGARVVCFTAFVAPPEGFEFQLGIYPTGMIPTEDRVDALPLHSAGVTVLDSNFIASTDLEWSKYPGMSHIIECDFFDTRASDSDFHDRWKPKFRLAYGKATLHRYDGNSFIKPHQDITIIDHNNRINMALATLVEWFHPDNRFHKELHFGRRTLRDTDRFVDLIMGSNGVESYIRDGNEPTEIEISDSIICKSGKAVLVNAVNPSFFHSVRCSGAGYGYSLITHIFMERV